MTDEHEHDDHAVGYVSPFLPPGHDGPHRALRTSDDPTPDDPTPYGGPRYRVLAAPYHDHEPGTCTPEDPDHRGHLVTCAAGHELLVLRPAPAGLGYPWEVLGVLRLGGARLDPAVARALVVDDLRRRAAPLETRVGPEHVDLYRQVPPP